MKESSTSTKKSLPRQDSLRYRHSRVFKDDIAQDPQAVEPVISNIMMYSLSKFNGQQQTRDGLKAPKFPFASQGEEALLRD